MPFTAPKSESTFDLVPAGNHVARVYRFLHLGTAPETYMGEEKMMNKIMIGFELLNETKVFKEERGPEPYVISREYTLSMGEKANLRKLVEGMYGVALQDGEADAFDLMGLVGEACLLNVVHKKSEKGTTYAMIQGASPIPKGMTVPPAHNKPQVLEYASWNEDLFRSFPDFIKEKFAKSVEFKKMRGIVSNVEEDISPEEVPFP